MTSIIFFSFHYYQIGGNERLGSCTILRLRPNLETEYLIRMLGHHSQSTDYVIRPTDKCNHHHTAAYNLYRQENHENTDGDRISNWNRYFNLVWDNCKPYIIGAFMCNMAKQPIISLWDETVSFIIGRLYHPVYLTLEKAHDDNFSII